MGMVLNPDQLPAPQALPHWKVILEEVFGIPVNSAPHLVPLIPDSWEEVSHLTGRSIEAVQRRIKGVITLAEHCEIDAVELNKLLLNQDSDSLILLDVREPWEFAIVKLPGSLLMRELNFQEWLPRFQQAAMVVTICHHGVRSFSAAMFLRERGVKHARSLAGGLDHWATVIEPQIARY